MLSFINYLRGDICGGIEQVGKVAGELYTKVYHEIYGLKYVILRYFSVYGPRQRGDIEYAAVIPKFIKMALNNEPLTIYGSGKQKRNFTYVSDCVNATMKAASAKNAVGKIINIVNTKESSIMNIVKVLSKLLGRKLKYKHTKPISGYPLRNLPDTTLQRKILNLEHKYGLEYGIKKC